MSNGIDCSDGKILPALPWGCQQSSENEPITKLLSTILKMDCPGSQSFLSLPAGVRERKDDGMCSLAALRKFSLNRVIDYSGVGGEVEDAAL